MRSGIPEHLRTLVRQCGWCQRPTRIRTSGTAARSLFTTSRVLVGALGGRSAMQTTELLRSCTSGAPVLKGTDTCQQLAHAGERGFVDYLRLSAGVWRLHMWNKSERKGAVDQAKGKVKQAVGKLTGNDDLKAKGQVDETVGKVETAVGRTGRKAGDAITRVGKAVKR
jgi:uncharacterized protein YjbJ (UPF0337 family)